MNRRNIVKAIVFAVLIVVSGFAGYELHGNSGTSSSTVALSETGSSLLYPAFNLWGPNFTKVQSSVTISPASTGSGTGISQAEKGLANFGASDAYIQGAIPAGVENIPILISYQYICYNIPGLNSVTLNLSAGIIAGIYMGTITSWNDTAIQAANPGVHLPGNAIIPIVRSDGSGDSFMFSSYLTKGNASWASAVGTSTNPSWPTLPQEKTGAQNTGLIGVMKNTPYTITYIAATYTSTVKADGFGIADLLNAAGNYVAPTIANVQQAANQYLSLIPSNGTIALQFAPGATSYPIADMEYIVVQKVQPSFQIAAAMQVFMFWVVSSSGGSSLTNFLSGLDLVPLPSSVVTGITMPLIELITG